MGKRHILSTKMYMQAKHPHVKQTARQSPFLHSNYPLLALSTEIKINLLQGSQKKGMLMPLIPAIPAVRQEELEFHASTDYTTEAF